MSKKINRGPGAQSLGVGTLVSQWKHELPDAELSGFFIGMCIARIAKLVDIEYNAMCRQLFGIQGSDMTVLFALRRSGKPYSMRPTDLFRALLITSGAVTKQVDRLVAASMVVRRADPDSNISSLVVLTAKGLKAVDAATDALVERAILPTVLREFTAAQCKNGERFLERVLGRMEEVAGSQHSLE